MIGLQLSIDLQNLVDDGYDCVRMDATSAHIWARWYHLRWRNIVINFVGVSSSSLLPNIIAVKSDADVRDLPCQARGVHVRVRHVLLVGRVLCMTETAAPARYKMRLYILRICTR